MFLVPKYFYCRYFLAKIILLLFLIQLSSKQTFAQSFAEMEKGIQTNFGLGKSASPTLKQLYLNKDQFDKYDDRSNAHSSLGLGMGVGFYLVYPINEIMAVISHSSLNYQTSTIYINHIRDSSAGLADGMRHRISSQGKLKQIFFAENILFRYKIGANKRWAILAGPTFTVSFSPALKSREESVYNSYRNGIISETFIVNNNQRVVLNQSSILNLAFSMGMERKCKRRLRNLTIGGLASYSLTANKLGTSKATFDESNSNDKVFSTKPIQGSSGVNTPLTDFRALRLEFFVRFKFKDKPAA